MTALAFTGERFIPGVAGEIWIEHWHRYHLALPLVAGKDVLDVACGAGYGSALLARRARSVCGVDIAPEALVHAASAHAGAAGLCFAAGDCARLPFAGASFDIVVSFETIEHIAAQEQFLDEIARVLRPGGLLVLSSPNRPEYSEARGTTNPYHVHELDRGELAALVGARFPHVAWYGQHLGFFSVLASEAPSDAGEIFEVRESEACTAGARHARALYYVVLASRSAETLAALPTRLSVLADADDWVRRDYEKVTRDLHQAHERGNALEREVIALQGHHAEAVRQRDRLQAAHDEARAQLDSAAAWRRKLEQDVASLQTAIQRRGGWRRWRAWVLRLLGERSG